MTSFWNITIWQALGVAEQAAIASGGAWNAFYFVRHARDGRGGRRLAAAGLALLFAALAVEAVAGLGVLSSAAEVARRAPLTLGVLYTTALIASGGRR
ncbi:MAG: hypothetical protein Q7K37_03760 [Dehalococcoidia bacterium]|nr:hypothetical protein [Dehalococcoidia bacterium]